MGWLDSLMGETRARLVRMVRRAALTVGELAEGLGISQNAVRSHVAAAERDGLVRLAGVQRSTGGKPAPSVPETTANVVTQPSMAPSTASETYCG